MTDKKPQVETKKITDFIPDSVNANTGTERGMRVLDDSVTKLGLGRSIVVDKHGNVIAGNKTQETAINNGFEDAIVVKTDGKKLVVVQREDLDLYSETDDKAKLLGIYDNRSGELNLSWDTDNLDALLHSINTDDERIMSELSQLAEEHDLYFGDEPVIPDAPDAQIDRAEELNEIWQVKSGDLWIIPSLTGNGEHRLLCGDSTNEADVARLMGGEKASIMLTDPPYNLASDSSLFAASAIRGSYEALKDSDWDKGFDPLLFLEAWKDYTDSDCWTYIFTSHFLFGVIYEWLKANRDKTSYGVWCKNDPMPSLSKSTWVSATELCVIARHGKTVFNYPINGHALNYWIESSGANTYHPTQKSVKLFCHILESSSILSSVVVEPFGGSGTTAIACEQLARQCRMIEIESKYCAVVLERMSAMGCEPVKATP